MRRENGRTAWPRQDDSVEFEAKLSPAVSGDAMRKLLCLCLVTMAAGLSTSEPRAETATPSFACSANATSVERAICADPKLASEERLMARLYELAKVSAFGRGPSNQQSVQREWLRGRNEGCAPSPANLLAECLGSYYAERNRRLASALIFSHPDVALPELARLDPDGAPMFEAIYLYARASRISVADRRRIVDLLERYKDTPGGWGEPADAVKSDSSFAEYIGVRSAGIPGERHGDRKFPCAAVVRKPLLIEATAPRFGSTMDNFVIRSDCEDTLPPLPKFSILVEKRGAGMTDCGGGTIRFAYYSGFRNASLAARLATGSQFRNARAKPFPRRRNVTSADTSAAVEELAAYYARYGRASPGQARPLARQMIYELLDEAWQC